MVDVTKVLKGLEAALEIAKKLAPAAQMLDLPAQVGVIANVASAAVEVASNLAERIEEGRVVATNEDAARVRAILADLQTENDKLAATIGRS